MSTYLLAHEFLRPVPAHALTPAALEAVERMKLAGAARRIDRICASIVTKHGNPPPSTYDGVTVTTNARKLLARAEAAGFVARLHDLPEACMVEGHLEGQRVGFRAWWTRGEADGASWHAPLRYEMRRDDRPIGVDQKAHTGKVGYRGKGLGTEHLRIVASPMGVPINHTELGKRMGEYDA